MFIPSVRVTASADSAASATSAGSPASGSLIAGFSQNMGMLIGSRAFQGLGIGGIMSLR